MIRSLTIGNFKCFRDPQTLSLSKLNIIYGHACSGKSSIVHAIRLILKTFTSDPIVKDVDFSFDSVSDLLPDKDVTKVLHASIIGDVLIPYVRKPISYVADLRLSASEGLLSTGVEVESFKISVPEMLQAMFSYLVRDLRCGRYNVRFESHYLVHSLHNVKVVYPRVTVVDRETSAILYTEILPKIIEEHIAVAPEVRAARCYSCREGLLSSCCRVAERVFQRPELKDRISTLMTRIMGRSIKIDIRKTSAAGDYCVEDIVEGINVSMESSGVLQILNVVTELVSLPSCGTLVVDEIDQYLDRKLMERAAEVIVDECIARDIQLVATTSSEIALLCMMKAARRLDVKSDLLVYGVERLDGSSRVRQLSESDVRRLVEDVRRLAEI